MTVKLAGEQRKLYAAHEQRLRAALTKTRDADFNTSRVRILAEFTLLRELCCDPRLVYADAKNGSAKLEAIDDLVANCMDEGKKVLIFSQFTSFLDLIGVRLAEHGVAFHVITGETPKRKLSLQAFLWAQDEEFCDCHPCGWRATESVCIEA